MIDEPAPVSIANAVSLTRSAPNSAVVLVEGEADSRLFRRYLLPGPQVRTVYCGGKPPLLEVARILRERSVTGVVGICDADSDRLLGVKPPPNIYLTDFSDLEMSIVMSDSFEAVLLELGLPLGASADSSGPDTVNATQFRDAIVRLAAPLGALRYLSRRDSLGLDFKPIDPGDYCENASTFDFDRLASALLDASPLCSMPLSALKSEATRLASTGDPQLVCGHDFCSVLDAAVAAATRKDRRGRATIESMLRLSYDTSNFARTGLIASLSEWEVSSGFEILRPEVLP